MTSNKSYTPASELVGIEAEAFSAYLDRFESSILGSFGPRILQSKGRLFVSYADAKDASISNQENEPVSHCDEFVYWAVDGKILDVDVNLDCLSESHPEARQEDIQELCVQYWESNPEWEVSNG